MGKINAEASSAEALYALFVQGEESAFEALVALYREPLTRFVYTIVADIDEAEELAIDAYARLALYRGHFRGESSLKTYLFAIGRNLALRHVRARSRQRQVYAPPVEASVEERVLRDERADDLHRALDGLPVAYRQAIHLLYFEGLTYAQAGRVMHKTRKQIDNLAQRAKAALRERLGKEEPRDDDD